MENLWASLIPEVNSRSHLCLLWLSCDFILGVFVELGIIVPTVSGDLKAVLLFPLWTAGICWRSYISVPRWHLYPGQSFCFTWEKRFSHMKGQCHHTHFWCERHTQKPSNSSFFSHFSPHCESALAYGTRKIQTLCFLQCPFHGDKLSSFAI